MSGSGEDSRSSLPPPLGLGVAILRNAQKPNRIVAEEEGEKKSRALWLSHRRYAKNKQRDNANQTSRPARKLAIEKTTNAMPWNKGRRVAWCRCATVGLRSADRVRPWPLVKAVLFTFCHIETSATPRPLSGGNREFATTGEQLSPALPISPVAPHWRDVTGYLGTDTKYLVTLYVVRILCTDTDS